MKIYPRKFLYEADFRRSAKIYILENNLPYGLWYFKANMYFYVQMMYNTRIRPYTDPPCRRLSYVLKCFDVTRIATALGESLYSHTYP